MWLSYRVTLKKLKTPKSVFFKNLQSEPGVNFLQLQPWLGQVSRLSVPTATPRTKVVCPHGTGHPATQTHTGAELIQPRPWETGRWVGCHAGPCLGSPQEPGPVYPGAWTVHAWGRCEVTLYKPNLVCTLHCLRRGWASPRCPRHLSRHQDSRKLCPSPQTQHTGAHHRRCPQALTPWGHTAQ